MTPHLRDSGRRPLAHAMAWGRARRRVPVLHQIDAVDCGPTCLEMVARYHGYTYGRPFIRQLCQQDRQGTSLAGLSRAAERLGFRTRALKLSLADLAGSVPLPCIVYWSADHFIVVTRIRGDRVYVVDPSMGRLRYRRAEFVAAWCPDGEDDARGVALAIEPSGAMLSMPAGSERPGTGYFLRPLWQGVRGHLLVLGTGALLAFAIQLALPFLGAALVDRGISQSDLRFVHVVLLAHLVLSLSKVSIDAIQGYIISSVGLRLEMHLVAAFVRKLTRLPLSFFDGRRIGELMQRMNDHQQIQQFLVESLSILVIASLSLVVFGVILALFRPLLFVIFAVGSLVYLLYCTLFFNYQRRLNYKNFQTSARKQGLIVEILSGMQEIKLNRAEQVRRREWEKAQRACFETQLKAHAIMRLQGGGGEAVNAVKNLLITLIVAREVIAGQMTLGTMVAIQALIGQLTWPLGQLALLLIRGQDAILCHERAREIHGLTEEDEGASPRVAIVPGDLVLRHVSFGYGGTRMHQVLRDVSLTIPRGKVTAIVGRSGSGKTTLLRLLLKFYAPDGGDIRLGDRNLADISHEQWRAAFGVVMQDGYIFSDTILGNIAVAEDEADHARVAAAARVAQIDTFVRSCPLGYRTRIGRDGVGISRGQMQRVLIARALYRNPDYLFFDEATSALDAETERVIVEALDEAVKGKTAVIVAHRLSTVRHADQIVVLDNGTIAEIGTHHELVKRRAAYWALVRHQLPEDELQTAST